MYSLTQSSRRGDLGRLSDRLQRQGKAVALSSLSFWLVPFLVLAESAWVVPGSDTASVSHASGLYAPAIRVDWKDASIDSWRPDEPLGPWSVVQVSPLRDVPASRISALLALGSPFGTAPDRIPTNAILDRAHLWLPISAIKGQFQVQLRALPAIDADWLPDEATPRFKRAGQAWSTGDVLDPSLPVLGSCNSPPETGWFEVPVNLAESLNELRLGPFAGWLLTSESLHAPEIRALQWTSAQSASTRDYPALYVEWHLPKSGPDLSLLPENVFSYTGEFTFLWSTNVSHALAVDGQPLTANDSGVWVVTLAPGVHEFQAVNSHGTSQRRLVVTKRPLEISAIERGPDQHVVLAWNGLPDWNYEIEEGEDGSSGWKPVLTVEGRTGPMAQSLPSPGIFRRYRLTAFPHPRLYSAP
ncbi:MAG: hypothetical protein JNK85_01505 [Verrucomicrobiales bacterium]|nr:hypothetical protein [Verrucomicrobiales bacterium]